MTALPRQSTPPFSEEQIAAAVKVCCEWDGAADADLAHAVLVAVAEKMQRDIQFRGMYGPPRSWRVAGPWLEPTEDMK